MMRFDGFVSSLSLGLATLLLREGGTVALIGSDGGVEHP